jgi:hypothetical protein
MSATRTAQMLSVYDGRERIGFILRRGDGGAEAFTTDDRSVGLFKDDQDAALELWRRARRQT